MKPPRCFISYSWDNDQHREWVRKLATRLRECGIDAILDQWYCHPGMDLTKFMEQSVRESSYVILVCTTNFAKKADAGVGGVGYEKIIVTGEIFTGEAQETKFVPVLREGEAKESLPSYLRSRLFVDFRADDQFEAKLEELLHHFHGEPLHPLPPIGPKPNWTQSFATESEQERTPEPQGTAPDSYPLSPSIKRKTSFYFKLSLIVLLSVAVGLIVRSILLNQFQFPKDKIPVAESKALSLPSPPSPITDLKINTKDEQKKEIPKPDSDLPKTYKNSVGMEFVLIPAGKFKVGSGISPEEVFRRYGGGAANWFENEHPQHPVEITKSFYLQKTEVTQGQWKKVIRDNPSRFKDCGEDCPVEQVSWSDIKEFIKKLNDMESTDTYRLPTEAEWECAARAETATVFSFGDDVGQLGEYVWFIGNSNYKTHPVGAKKSNGLGLYDMHGNVWEWCQDWYDNDYYQNSPSKNPNGPETGTYRVARGGSWYDGADYCRSATRFSSMPDDRRSLIGFRLAMSVALGS